MEKKLLGIEAKHWVIGAWILSLGLVFCDIVNTTDILGIILRMIGLISLGFGTYYYGKGKQQDSLIFKFGANVICDEFRKFKGLTYNTYVSVNELYDCIIVNETDKPDELFIVSFGLTKDMYTYVYFDEVSDVHHVTEILNKK